MAGSGRRFALEAAFLAGLAVAVGLAGLSTARIIGVMALGWLLTVLVELVSWRLAVRHPTGIALPAPASSAAADAPAAMPQEEASHAAHEQLPEHEEEARPEEHPAGEDAEPAPVAEEHLPLPAAEPARERRRGFWRRRAVQEAEPEPPPRHVRLIPKPPGEADGDAEVSSAERAEGA
jgi:hypothetical protein